MQFSQVLITSIVAAIAVVGITHAFASWGESPAYASAQTGPRAMRASWSGGGHGWFGGNGGRGDGAGRHGFRAFCDNRSNEWIGDMLALGERRLDLGSEQKPVWDELGTAVRAASDDLAALCGQMTDAPERSADAKLVQAETMMAAGLDALRRVQPAFHALYAALDDSQRKTLDDLAAHRRRH